MTQQTAGNDRRRYQRHPLRSHLSVELRVQGSGDMPALLLTRGMVADISCGGLRCDIDLDVPVGTKVDVCFPDSPDAELQHLMDGHVVRTDSLGGVPDQVAIAFAEPLDAGAIERLFTEPVPAPRRGRTAATRRASWADEPHAFPTFATGSLL